MKINVFTQKIRKGWKKAFTFLHVIGACVDHECHEGWKSN